VGKEISTMSTLCDPRQPLSEIPFVFLDTETTGLSFYKGEDMVEVATVRVQGYKVQSAWYSLVKPFRQGRQVPVSQGAFNMHKLSDKDLVDEPLFEEVYPQLLKETEGAIVVAHNAKFDLQFLANKVLELGMNLPLWPVLDSVKIAKAWCRNSPKHGLDNLVYDLRVPREHSHRALTDAFALAGVFYTMALRQPPDEVLLGHVMRVHGDTMEVVDGLQK